MITNKSFLLLIQKFPEKFINDTLTWKKHIDCIIPNLSTECYIMGSLKPYMSHNSLRMVYYFHSFMNYGLLFLGNCSYSIRNFRLQKYIIRMTLGCKSRDSYMSLFKKLNILPLPSQYIYSLLPFVINKKDQ